MSGMRALLMEDHGDAYPFWKEADIRGATCLHVDAHLDVSDDGFTPESLQRIAACRGREDLGAFRGSDFLPWGGIHCGNYLYPALREGVVGHLVWVVPPHLLGDDPLDWLRGELQGWVELTLSEYRNLRREGPRLEGTLQGRRLTVCTAEHLPALRGPLLLDIDVDYYLDADDQIWQDPFGLRRALGDLRPEVLTVAYSVNGGYTPMEHRYLGDVTLLAFGGAGDPTDDWPAVVARIVEADRRRHRDPRAYAGIPREGRPAWLQAALALKEGEPRRAAALDPGYRIQAINQGALEFRRKRYGEARKWLQRGRTENPAEAPLCRYMEGLAWAKEDRYREAEETWRPLEENPSLGEVERAYVSFMRGNALCRLGRLEESLVCYRKALAREPHHPVYLHHYGLALQEAGRLAEAGRALRRSLRLAPDRLGSLETRQALVELYRRRGQRALAQAEARRLKELDVTGIYRLRAILDEA